MNTDLMKASVTLATDITNYLASEDGSKARRRLATKSTTSTLVGADGITRVITSPPKGAFIEVPDAIAKRAVSSVKAHSDASEGIYQQFTLADVVFDIGSCGPNRLTNSYELWFVEEGQLGITSKLDNDDLIAGLRAQSNEREIMEVDTSGAESAVKSPEPVKASSQKNLAEAGTEDDNLPF